MSIKDRLMFMFFNVGGYVILGIRKGTFHMLGPCCLPDFYVTQLYGEKIVGNENVV